MELDACSGHGNERWAGMVVPFGPSVDAPGVLTDWWSGTTGGRWDQGGVIGVSVENNDRVGIDKVVCVATSGGSDAQVWLANHR